ncbi:MAG TPA: hypothetical protein VFO79_17280, partial [Xanthomonadales bacterium]|nr:hypothetical protein [Xanthomonadales bacterium]
PRAPRYVPLLALHGDADSTVAPANTERLVAQWHASGPSQDWTRASDGGNGAADARCERWIDADGRPMLEHWRVRGAGHAWSGGDPQGSYADPNGPDASALMLRFFAAHALG